VQGLKKMARIGVAELLGAYDHIRHWQRQAAASSTCDSLLPGYAQLGK
jgi:hypothetical protein